MEKRLFILVLFCSLPGLVQSGATSAFGSAQSDSATSPANGLIKRGADTSSQTSSGQKMVRMTVDAVVADGTGKPITGLGKDDFTLLDNGKPARIVSVRPAAVNGTDIDSVQVILLVDTLNNSFESVATERDQIVRYLSQNGGQLSLPMSIALLSDSGVKLDQPSRDGNVLIAELKQTSTAIRTFGSATGSDGAIERFQRSLKALTQLLTYEQNRPGRKLLLWIGPGWPMLAGTRFGSSARDDHANFDSIVSFSTGLREARTTLYSIDLEGGVARSVFYQNFLKPVTNVKLADSGSLSTPVLAIQSGGLVLKGSSDLVAGISSCLVDAHDSYALTFDVPPSDTVNDYHSLEVRLAKPGLAVRTNTGYYAQPYSEPRQAGATPIGGDSTLRSDVRLVVVDITVSDGKGSPVKGLKASDFQLKEDGNPQRIASLEEHSATASSMQTAPQAIGADGTISASNKPTGSAGIWNVLLFDQFNTSREDQVIVLQQVKRFAKQLPSNEPVALVAMSGQIKILSSFGEGAGAVARLLDKNGLPPSGSLEPPNIVERGGIYLDTTTNPDAATNKARTDVDRQAQHAQKSLDNFLALAKWLTSYPGRKNVYWLTAGFPLQGQGFTGGSLAHLAGTAETGGQMAPTLEKTDKALETARVAIYPIDARGVAVQDIASETSADSGGSNGVNQDNTLNGAHTTAMRSIANATGGVASFNNDIAKTLQEDFDRGASYYTISYTPSDTTWNGSYRKINLSLEQPGYHLTYRQGYYAKDLEATAPTNDEFRMALRRDAPAESAVLFSVKVNKAGDSVNVEYGIESQTLHYQPDASGKLVATAECAVVAYDAGGKVVGTSLIQFSSAVSPEQRAALANGTIHAKQTIAVKGNPSSLVLGVRDRTTGSFGNLQVGSLGN